MPKGIDIDKIVAEVLRNLGKSGVVDDAAKIGGNVVDNISKALSEATGKIRKPKTPKTPKSPKNPPAGGVAVPKTPKGPKPKGPKSGSADKLEREAQRKAERQAKSDAWAKQREAYNQMKAIERQERKAANRAEWAKIRQEKFQGNITEAVKATSRGRSRNKKKGVK